MASRCEVEPPARTAEPSVAARVTAGAVILLAALGLVLLGGCFLIGVLLVEGPNGAGAPAWPQGLLLTTLYVMAFLCFAGALALFVIGLRGLIVVLHGRHARPHEEGMHPWSTT
jgi:hypothetical protein